MLACPPSILRTPRTRLSDAQSQAEARCQPSVGTEPSSNSRDQTDFPQPSELQVSLLVQGGSLRSPRAGPAPGRAGAPVSAPLQRGRRPCRALGDQPPEAREEVHRGWGGRLHGFRQPLWREPRRSWPQRRALPGRSTDCPTRRKLTGP
jgi:hypothetical protein